jgi:hypothetical protein
MKFAVKMKVTLLFVSSVLLVPFTPAGAVPVPAGLRVVAEIPVPNWTSATTFDLLSFDTTGRVMYIADRTNHGLTAIDANPSSPTFNKVLGTIPIPNACADSNNVAQCPSGVVVAPDLRKLIATDRALAPASGHVYIYDLSTNKVPTVPQFTVTLANARGIDELDYDPINQRLYVNNTDASGGGFFMTVIDPKTGQVIGQIPLPASPEQARFNPVDHLIYTTIAGNNSVLRIDPNNPANGGAGAIVATFATDPGCSPAGIDIDPGTDRALIGCNNGALVAGQTGAAQELMDLSNGNILQRFPDITRSDVLAFDPVVNKFFTGSGNNVNNVVGCPPAANNAALFPVIGVFSPNGTEQVQCGGQRSTVLGVDPITGNIYVPMELFPASGPAGTNFFTGVVVFAVTPEPSSLLLLGLGLIAVVFIYRRSV